MAYTPAATWVAWNQTYTTANTINIQGQVWGQWNQIYYQGTNVVSGAYTANQPPPTEEEIRIATARAEDARKQAAAAQVRAEALLLEHLDPHQRESYRKDKLFIVETRKKNRYQLSHARQPRKLDGTKEVVSYCIHTYGVPREDELLGFKLLLEANEDEFLKTANATRLAA